MKIEVKVRERKRLGGEGKKDKQGMKNTGQQYGEAFFYDGHWQQTSQMGMASLVQDERSGDYDVVTLNGTNEKGRFILQDLLLHTDMARESSNNNNDKNDNNNDNDGKQQQDTDNVLAADTVFRVPSWSALMDDVYPPVRAPDSSRFLPVQQKLSTQKPTQQSTQQVAPKDEGSQVFWVSTPGTATTTTSTPHHTVYTQLRGSRRFTMYSERHEMNLMVYPSIHPLAGHSRWHDR